MSYNAILGGALLILGCATATIPKSPVRRLRLLEWTLLAALGAPLLASITLPWQWSLHWLPPEPSTVAGPATGWPTPAARQNREATALQVAPVDVRVSGAASGPVATSSKVTNANFRLGPAWGDVLLALNGGVVALLTAWWLLGAIVLARLWSRGLPAQSRLGFPAIATKRIAEVKCHPKVLTPCAFGLKRWRILLPTAMTGSLQAQAMRFALAHELSHLERGDLWTWRLTRLAQATLWFQPAYWWLRGQVRLCQDYLADADSAEFGGRAECAAFLVDAAQTEQVLLAGAALPLSSRPSDLARRVAMLLNSPAPLERRCPRWIEAAAALAAVTLLTAAAVFRLEAQPATQPNALTYRCWVLTYGTEAPIAGAKVVVRRSLLGDPRYGSMKLLESTEHTTDAAGYCSFTLAPEQVAERYLYIELDVSHPEHAARNGFGYALSMIRKNEEIGGRPFFETTRLHPAKPVTGKLLTPAGRPAANVRISGYTYPDARRVVIGESVDEDTQGSFFESTTDDAGRFSVPIATPGQGAFWFLPTNAAPLGVVAPAARGDLGDVRLKAGVRTRALVVDAEGKPVSDVRVSVRRSDRESSEIDEFNRTSMATSGYSREATTDTLGRFQLAPVNAGQYEFRIDEARQSGASAKYAGTFLHRRVSLTTDGQQVQFRAVPTVAIRVKNVDASGKPKRGHEFMVAGVLGVLGAGSGDWFHTNSDRPESGLGTAYVPKGLQNVQITFMDNEHGSFRVRRSAGAPPEAIREIKLDRLDTDLEGIEVIRYKAPILLVKGVDADGNAIPDFKPSARSREPGSSGTGDAVHFEKQADGRWRSMSLVPDMETTVGAANLGWNAETRTLTLAEGQEKEVVLTITR